jgi:hypothetical protein
MGAALIHMDRWLDRHDEPNRQFLQVCKGTKKLSVYTTFHLEYQVVHKGWW